MKLIWYNVKAASERQKTRLLYMAPSSNPPQNIATNKKMFQEKDVVNKTSTWQGNIVCIRQATWTSQSQERTEWAGSELSRVKLTTGAHLSCRAIWHVRLIKIPFAIAETPSCRARIAKEVDPYGVNWGRDKDLKGGGIFFLTRRNFSRHGCRW